MNAPIHGAPPLRNRDPERLIRASSHVDRLPLLRFLLQPRSEVDVQREFPGVPTVEVRRSMVHLEASQWIRERGEPMGESTWSIDSGAVEFLKGRILDQVPTAIPVHRLCATQLGFELVVLRRRSCVAVLKALQDGRSSHREIVAATGLQSGTVSDAIARLQRASIIKRYRLDHGPRLHLLRLLIDLSGK